MDQIKTAKRPPTVTRIGSYRLVRPLGSGGMSSVFLAEHVENGFEVALKVLPRFLAKNGTLLQRFLREADNAEALEHPNIVSIFDRGSEDGRHYLVLEYVPGLDLHEWVRQEGPMPWLAALRVVEKAAEGLQYAASKGVIHRDIKPANLLLSQDGAVKLIDLGLAFQNDAEDERVTRDGTTVGTVDYMSPEQARDSRSANARSDLYSLGCTLYYLLTGFPPFPGGNIGDKLRRHVKQEPPDVRALRPDVPRGVAQLIQRMMAKAPDDRFPDHAALIAEVLALQLVPPDDANGGTIEFAQVVDDELDADFVLGDGVSIVDVPSTLEAPPVADDVLDAQIVEDDSSEDLDAEIVPEDEDEDDENGVESAPPRRRGDSGLMDAIRALDLTELLADEDEQPAQIRSKAIPREAAPAPLPRSPAIAPDPDTDPDPDPDPDPDESFDPFEDLDEEDDVPLLSTGPRRRYGEDASARAWAIGGAVIGLGIALLGFILISLLRMDW